MKHATQTVTALDGPGLQDGGRFTLPRHALFQRLYQDGCVHVVEDPMLRELDHMIRGVTPLGLRRCHLWPNDDDAFLEAVLQLVEKKDPTTGVKLRKAAAELGMGTLQDWAMTFLRRAQGAQGG